MGLLQKLLLAGVFLHLPIQAADRTQLYDVTGRPISSDAPRSDPTADGSATDTTRGQAGAAPVMPSRNGPVETGQGRPLERSGSLLQQALPAPPELNASKVVDHESAVINVELLLLSPSLDAAEQQRKALARQGVKVSRRQILKGLGMVLSTYRIPPDVDPIAFLAQLRQALPQTVMEYNQRYRLQGQRGEEYATGLTGLTDVSHATGIEVAMLDAALDPDNIAFRGSQLNYQDVTGRNPGPTEHGTAVASILIGQGDPVQGVLPQARLTAINIFFPDENGEQETRTDFWLKGLDRLAQLQPRPRVVNMSFGGAESRLLQTAMQRLARDMRFVAAAGNGGPQSRVMFPASMEQVVAVTAVDRKKRIYRNAPHDRKITVAAPGVDVWVAGLESGYYATGTSFAAPWVTAAVALQLSGKKKDLNDLWTGSEDLGEAGPDAVFGHGLLQYKK
ncbi:MAG: S8 family serine peptidase [Chromatiales bacterium]|jgi:subtilisin family serine protease